MRIVAGSERGWAAILAIPAIAVMSLPGRGDPVSAQDAFSIVIDADASSAAVDPAADRGVGERFSVAVAVDNLQGERGLGSVTFQLAYDPAILRALLIRESSQLMDANFNCNVRSVTAPGFAELDCALDPLPADGPEGDTIRLADIQFEAIAPGSSTLTLREAAVSQGTGSCIIEVDNCRLPAELFVPAVVTVSGVAPSPGPTDTSVAVGGEVQVTLRLDPPEGIAKGDEFRIIASATNVPAPGLGRFLIDLRFDKAVLDVLSTIQADDVEGMSCANLDTDEPGIAQLVCAFLPQPPQGPTGDLMLGAITFKAKGTGDTQLRSPVVALIGVEQSCFFSTDITTGEGCDKPVADTVDVPPVKIPGGDTPWLLVGAVIAVALAAGAGGLTLATRRRRTKEAQAQ